MSFACSIHTGIALEDLGMLSLHPSPDPGSSSGVRRGAGGGMDHRRAWQIFADNFYLFAARPPASGWPTSCNRFLASRKS